LFHLQLRYALGRGAAIRAGSRFEKRKKSTKRRDRTTQFFVIREDGETKRRDAIRRRQM